MILWEKINMLFICNEKKCFIFKGSGALKLESFQFADERKGEKELWGSRVHEVFAVLRDRAKLHRHPSRVPKPAAGRPPPCCRAGREPRRGSEQKAPAFRTRSPFLPKESPEIINVILMA